MHLVPLITVKACEPISFAQAHKLIKKFHNSCVSKASQSLSLTHSKNEPTVSEDILEKLSTLVTEIKNQADKEPVGSALPESKKKRKRDSEVSAATNLEMSEKKKKKSKKSEK